MKNTYIRIGKSTILHMYGTCHYVQRSTMSLWQTVMRRTGVMRVCDECQRLERKAKKSIPSTGSKKVDDYLDDVMKEKS